jgi:uncharacterized membrane protein
MNPAVQILGIAVLMAILDAPWLLMNNRWVKDFVEEIQGNRAPQFRMWAGVPVYLALAYMVTQAPNAPRAFLLGLSTYAVYDFTNVFVFDKYPLTFAVADSLWGGALMAVTWWVANRIGLLRIA